MEYVKITTSTPEKMDEKKIAFNTQATVEYVGKNEIIRAFSEGNYTTVYLSDDRRIVVSKNLKQMTRILSDEVFIKTHQSHIINRNFIARFIKVKGGYFEMTDHSSVPVSRRKKKEVFKSLNIKSE